MRTLTVDPAVLRPALSLAMNAVGSKTLPPVCSFVLLESAATALRLTISNLHYSITVEVEAICDEPVEVGVEAKRLYSLISAIDELVTMKQHKGGLAIGTAMSVHYLPILAAERFPLPDIATDCKGKIAGSLLYGMLVAATSAAETNQFGEQRWQALEWSGRDGRLTITGCHGFFLISTETAWDGEFYALVPLKGTKAIQALAKQSEEVSIAVSRNLLTAISAEGSVSVQLNAVPWPDWKMLIADQYDHTVEVEPAAVVTALKRAMLSCRLWEDKIDPRVDVKLTRDKATLLCQGHGESREQIAIKGNSDVSFTLNGTKLATFLRLVKGEVVWEFSKNSAIRLTPKERGAFTVQCLLMPMVNQ